MGPARNGASTRPGRGGGDGRERAGRRPYLATPRREITMPIGESALENARVADESPPSPPPPPPPPSPIRPRDGEKKEEVLTLIDAKSGAVDSSLKPRTMSDEELCNMRSSALRRHQMVLGSGALDDTQDENAITVFGTKSADARAMIVPSTIPSENVCAGVSACESDPHDSKPHWVLDPDTAGFNSLHGCYRPLHTSERVPSCPRHGGRGLDA